MEEVSQHCSTGLADCCAGSDQPAVAAAAGSNEVSAQAAAANRDAADPKQVGRWDPTFKLPNVAIHAHLLPNGKVLFWGRRDQPNLSLDEHFCTPQVWDPVTREITTTPKPTLADGRTTVNLFCSGHVFLPGGRLLVAGGHLFDSKGLPQAATYDYRTNTWTALPLMNNGRWYPTVVALHDGSALVMSGSFEGPNGSTPTNEVQQVWDGHVWRSLVNFHGLPLYPRVHAAPNGQVFMSGPLPQTYTLDTEGGGNWTPLPGAGGSRASGPRDYAPSVMYDVGKVVYIGGGNNPGSHVPTAAAEIIDLTAANPAWRRTADMHQPRRQHNATILPDGTVLVTGGTKGGGGKNDGFNDLTPHQPVHEPELWDPATGQWTLLAAEAVDRCYHATAILLPDSTVLSAGGGEYRPDSTPAPNPPEDSHHDAQIYHPPYLFRGPRPDLTSAPEKVSYGQSFEVGTSHPDQIGLVSLVRLSSVTHSFNMNQRLNFLTFRTRAGGLTLTAPDNADVCPPGHYMLFLLNKSKVPSIAKIVRVAEPVGPRRTAATRPPMSRVATLPAEAQLSTAALDQAITSAPTGTHVVVGLTSRCPYGLGACWGGAYHALQKLDGVQSVRPVANAEDSTAELYLRGDTLPDIGRWEEQLIQFASGSYDFRGVEVSINASVRAQDGGLRLIGPSIDKPVTLAPLEQTEKVQFHRPTGTAKPATGDELAAYQSLVVKCRDVGTRDVPVRITGPLKMQDAGWVLHVRSFEVQAG